MNSWWIAIHLIRRALDRKWSFILHMVLPSLVAAFFIGILGGGDLARFRLDVVNADQGSMGRTLLRDLQQEHLLSIRIIGSEAEAADHVRRQEAEAALIIPASFTAELKQGRTPKVDLQYMYTSEGTGFARQLLEDKLMLLTVFAVSASKDDINVAEEARVQAIYEYMEAHGSVSRIRYEGMASNQGISSSMGMLMLFIMVLVSSSISLISEDRSKRTMQRIFAAPVRPLEIAVGNFAGCFLLGTVQIGIVLLFTRGVLRYSYGLGFFTHWVVLECFLLAAIGVAAAIAGLIRNNVNSAAIHSWIITPTCMLGGCFWPVYIMPELLQKISYFVPQKWALDAILLMASGASLADVKVHLGILLLFAFVLLSFGASVLRPGEEDAAG